MQADYREIFKKPGFHAVCYIGTMPRLVQIETCFLGDNSEFESAWIKTKTFLFQLVLETLDASVAGSRTHLRKRKHAQTRLREIMIIGSIYIYQK